MELKEAVENRFSVRKFTSDPVELADLREMVRRAGLSPSVNNSQPWKFVAITNRDLLQRMAVAVENKLELMLPEADTDAEKSLRSTVNYFSTFFKEAPAVIAVLMQPYEALVDKLMLAHARTHAEINVLRNQPDVQSIGGCIQTILLTAVDLGYGACWLSGMMVASEELHAMLSEDATWQLMAFVAVGKPAVQPRQKERRPVDEMFVHLA